LPKADVDVSVGSLGTPWSASGQKLTFRSSADRSLGWQLHSETRPTASACNSAWADSLNLPIIGMAGCQSLRVSTRLQWTTETLTDWLRAWSGHNKSARGQCRISLRLRACPSQ